MGCQVPCLRWWPHSGAVFLFSLHHFLLPSNHVIRLIIKGAKSASGVQDLWTRGQSLRVVQWHMKGMENNAINTNSPNRHHPLLPFQLPDLSPYSKKSKKKKVSAKKAEPEAGFCSRLTPNLHRMGQPEAATDGMASGRDCVAGTIFFFVIPIEYIMVGSENEICPHLMVLCKKFLTL